jgi:hypothetical protein
MKYYFWILIFIISICALSCGKKNKVHKEIKVDTKSTISINLPDSVSIDSLLVGHIDYEEQSNPLPLEEIYKKYTFLYATISKNRINSFNELLKVPHDTFVAINNSIIPIYDLKPLKKGDMFFEGFIVNQFIYKVGKDSARIVNQDIKVSSQINVY